MRKITKKEKISSSSVIVILCLAKITSAEVVFDGSVGPPGMLAGNMVIDDSFGQQLGSNLFHSFHIFNINPGETATFTSASLTPIDNVISRVTGGFTSTIDGELGSTIPGASIWLINPSGIVFGENATLDISGSFYASTADYLPLEDGGRFGADLSIPANTMLTVADPAAFGFVDASVAPLSIQDSILQVNDNEALTFVGGDISVSSGLLGFLAAPGGDINIAAIASAGEAIIGAKGIDTSGFMNLGNLTMTDGFVFVAEFGGLNGAGSVYIRGGDIVVESSQFFSFTTNGDSGVIDIGAAGDAIFNQTSINSSSDSIGLPSDIFLTAGGNLLITQDSEILSTTFSQAEGGDIVLEANNIVVAERSFVFSGTGGTGTSGDVILTATGPGDVLVTQDSEISSTTVSPADAGDIVLEANNITVSERSRVSSATLGAGTAGDVIATATGTIDISNSSGDNVFATGLASETKADFDFGAAGDVFVLAESLIINFGVISSESVNPNGFGDAGNIFIDVTDVEMSGEGLITSSTRGFGGGGFIAVNSSNAVQLTDLFTAIQSTSNGPGDSGPISITTPQLTLVGGALIQTAPFSSGSGGDIFIDVDRLTLSNSQISSGPIFTASVPSSGQAGAITIHASESVRLDNPLNDEVMRPRITSTTFGTGDAGAISVFTPDLTLDRGSIDSNSLVGPFGPIAGTGDAGQINIDVEVLSLVNGGSVSSDTDTDGAGGAITINAADSVLISGQNMDPDSPIFSNISTLSFGSGDAGSIDIITDSLLVDDQGNISATTAFGSALGGSIHIDARDVRLDNGGLIFSASLDSTGNAGSILLDVDTLSLFADSLIATSSNLTAGGNIDVQATGLVHIVDSEITSEANGVTPMDSGGNITVSRPEFFVLNNSEVIASANAGNGGNISIETGAFVASSDSIVNASSNTGVDGIITIESPNDVTGTVVELDAEIFPTDQLQADRCSPRAIRERSTFTLAGGGLRPRPDEFLSSVADAPIRMVSQSVESAQTPLAFVAGPVFPAWCEP